MTYCLQIVCRAKENEKNSATAVSEAETERERKAGTITKEGEWRTMAKTVSIAQMIVKKSDIEKRPEKMQAAIGNSRWINRRPRKADQTIDCIVTKRNTSTTTTIMLRLILINNITMIESIRMVIIIILTQQTVIMAIIHYTATTADRITANIVIHHSIYHIMRHSVLTDGAYTRCLVGVRPTRLRRQILNQRMNRLWPNQMTRIIMAKP
mmetsp:Transcript_73708/g.117510  ORF Transcript_73708/g.117510 Transcript_73708/m.117510 type:complete len:210 (-) Transcript_73708:300-929(-)